MEKHNKAFGSVIRRLRREKGWSQDELSHRADVARSHLSLLELGRKSPTLDSIFKLCRALAVSLPMLAILIDEKLRNNVADAQD